MPKTTIDQVDVQGKSVLMRVDFNVPMENGEIKDDRRIRLALPSIKSVVDRGGKLILMSHLGRPGGKGVEREYSLAPVAAHLSTLLGSDVGFPSNDCIDDDAASAVAHLEPGRAILLENLRFHGAEKKGSPEFGSRLASYGDIYCNDAFGTCHRDHASMVAVPRAMEGKPRVSGLLLKKELDFQLGALESPKRPFVAVLGGAKVSDKIKVVDELIRKTDAVLVGGAMSYTFLHAMERHVGKSRVEADRLDDAHRLIDLAAREKCELHLPMDHVCNTEFSDSTGDIEFVGDQIPENFMALDIGPKTQSIYSQIIKSAKTIVWNGPMGVFEWRPFRVGTQQVASAIADATDAGATSIVGGGDSARAAEEFGFADRYSHVSTGGGASLELLAGEQFASLAALDDA